MNIRERKWDLQFVVGFDNGTKSTIENGIYVCGRIQQWNENTIENGGNENGNQMGIKMGTLEGTKMANKSETKREREKLCFHV